MQNYIESIARMSHRCRLVSKSECHIAIIVFLCLAAYSGTFQAPFVFDDLDSIVDNEVITNIGNFLQGSAAYAIYPRRYVGYLTFALNHAMGGLDVTVYHIVNLVIHAINAALVYCLVLLTFKTPKMKPAPLSISPESLSFFCAAIFAVHPVQTQAVTYIVQRLTSLCTLFYLSSLCLYIKARLTAESNNDKRGLTLSLYVLAFTAALLAMKTKEIAFTLPLALLIYDLIFISKTVRKSFVFAGPILLTLLVIPMSMLNIAKPLGEVISDVSTVTRVQTAVSRFDYLMTQFRVLVTYLRLLFFPINQNMDYDYPIYHSLFSSPVLLSFSFLITIFILALAMLWHARRHHNAILRIAGYGILWFFVALSVESSIIPIADVIFEHRMYLPSIGMIIAVVAGLSGILAACIPYRFRKWAGGVGLLAIVILTIGTYNRNTVWASEISLWSDTVWKSPAKARPYDLLGAALAAAGRNEEAIPVLMRALELQPRYAEAYNNLGIALSRQGRQAKAAAAFREAISIKPDLALAYHNLGRIYLLHDGDYRRAIEMMEKTIALKPNYVGAYINMAAAYNEMAEFDKAARVLENIMTRAGDRPETHYNLGMAYWGAGDRTGAMRELTTLRGIDENLAKQLETVFEVFIEKK